MSIATAITNAQNKVAAAYTAVSNKGGTLPATQNLSNLPTAIGSISTPVTKPLDATPSTSMQTFNPPSGYDGYSPVYVYAVTSSIDANITAGNIKNGVTILGVTGTYSGGSGSSSKYDVTIDSFLGDVSNGELGKPTYLASLNTGNTITSIGKNALMHAFYGNSAISSVSMPEVTEIKQSGLECAFCSNNSATPMNLHTISFPKLTTVGVRGCYRGFLAAGLSGNLLDFSKITSLGADAFYEAFRYNSNLSGTVNFSSLTTISGDRALYGAFGDCDKISAINFNNLQQITANSGLSYTFKLSPNANSQLTSVSFPQLSVLSGSSAMSYCFAYCNALTSLSFPALTSGSFGNKTDQFINMLLGVTGCTVHFPSNLQSTIGSWSSVTAGFGGTNTTVLFDLTATT